MEQYQEIPHLNTTLTIIKCPLQQLPAPTSTVDSLRDIMLGPPANGTRLLVTTCGAPSTAHQSPRR